MDQRYTIKGGLVLKRVYESQSDMYSVAFGVCHCDTYVILQSVSVCVLTMGINTQSNRPGIYTYMSYDTLAILRSVCYIQSNRCCCLLFPLFG